MKVVAEPAAGVTVRVSQGEPESVAPGGAARCLVRVSVRAEADWSGRILVSERIAAREPWWLIPGLFYGENRPARCQRLFPRYQAGVEDQDSLTSSHWSFRADRAATVAVFAWGDDSAVALAADETTACGMSGLGFADLGGEAEIQLRFPYREEPFTYYGDAVARPPLAEVMRLAKGGSASFDFQLFRLGPDRHGYAEVLELLRREALAANPVQPWVDIAQAAELTAYGLHRWHYRSDPDVLIETAAFDRGIDGGNLDRQAMHVGWISGIPWAYALLRHARRIGNGEYRQAASKVIDFCCAELSPSGTFWGTWYREGGWKGSWTPLRNGLHARTLGEATLFLLRAIREEAAQGREHPTWKAAACSNLAQLVARQRPDGNLGAIHDLRSGEVLLWDGAAALMWIPAFIEAAEMAELLELEPGPEPTASAASPDKAPPSNQPFARQLSTGALLAAAAAAGDYYSTFVLDEYINGAPEDVDLAPTSEDGYAAVMAYTALARHFGARRWLDLARRSADFTFTFRYSYNVSFDPLTILGDYGFATRGGDQASVSNQHLGSYGLICSAELAELSTLLGDPSVLERAEETLACFRQFIARRDGDFNAYRGMVTERYYHTECFAPKGMILTLSHSWCLGVALLACEQALAGWSRLDPASQGGGQLDE
ncbi:MAG: hypothetical protein LBI99_09565 [Propionibacteriaceae bacterium]|jgi:hypothetical protein|nr:hypothetical protein [Propionibacteriaceae bacterium]